MLYLAFHGPHLCVLVRACVRARCACVFVCVRAHVRVCAYQHVKLRVHHECLRVSMRMYVGERM